MAELRENPSTDAAANAQTTYSLAVGDTFKGVFDGEQDNDWVRVELVEGKTYEIHLAGAGDNSGADTILRVFNSAGAQVAVNDDSDFAAGQLDSRLSFIPDSSGVYYLSAGLYLGNPAQDHTGAYTLTLVDPEAGDTGRTTRVSTSAAAMAMTTCVAAPAMTLCGAVPAMTGLKAAPVMTCLTAATAMTSCPAAQALMSLCLRTTAATTSSRIFR